MLRSSYFGFVGLLIYLIVSANSSHAIDDVQFTLEEQYGPPAVRWDNIVKQKPYWISSPEHASLGKNLEKHYVVIEPGGEIVIRLDRDSILRMHAKECSLDPEMFDVKISNGSGLYYNTAFQKTDTLNNLLLTTKNYAWVVRISLKPHIKEPVKAMFFASRYEPIPKFAFYPYDVNVDSNLSMLSKVGHDSPKVVDFEMFNKLKPGVPVKFDIEGPARLEVTSQYIFDETDSGKDVAYKMYFELGHKQISAPTFIARPDYNNLYKDKSILSKSDANYIRIPRGRHRVKVVSDAPVYMQIHSLEQDGYLLDEFNVKTKAIDVDKKLKSKPCKDCILPSKVKEMVNLAQDNEWKPAGLKATEAASNLWSRRKDDKEIRNYRDNVAGMFTFFRDLLPSDLKYAKKLSIDWIIDYALVDADKQNLPYKVIDTQVDKLLKELISGYFIELMPSSDMKLNYIVPDLGANSELRVIVQQANLNKAQNLYIRYNDGPTKLFTIYPTRDLEWSAYAPNQGIIGLSILEKHQFRQEKKMATLSGLFSRNNVPGNLHSAGNIVIPLPKETKSIQVWQDSGVAPLKVGLQYRAPKKFNLSSANEVRELSQLPARIKPSLIFISSLRYFDFCQKNNCNSSSGVPTDSQFFQYLVDQQILKPNELASRESVLDLYNHWLDLTRFLYERYQKFASEVTQVDRVFIAPTTSTSRVNERELKQAGYLMETKKWSAAAILWSHIIPKANLNLWRVAHMARIEALKNSGENFLAELALKALVVNSQDSKIRLFAYTKLLSLYAQREYYYGMEGLVAAYLINLGDKEEQIKTLSNILLKDNMEDKALDLAILLEDKKPSEEVVFAAMKTEDGRIGLRAGEKLETTEEKHFWQAQELQKIGRYHEALQEFRHAGLQGKVWGKHLKQALEIREELKDKSSEIREEAIKKWLNWFYNHPGPRRWESAHFLVKDFYESAIVYAGTRYSYATSFVASPRGSVALKIIGPVKLQVRARPILETDAKLLKNGDWVIIKIDNKPRFAKVDNYDGGGVLKIVGRDDLKPGIEQRHEFDVPPGEHKIIIESRKQKVLVEPYVQMPIFAITALPAVTPQTVSFIQNKFWQPLEHNSSKHLINYELVETTLENNRYLRKLSKQSADLDLLPIDYDDCVVNLNPDSLRQMVVQTNKDKNKDILDRLSQILFEYQSSLSKNLLVTGLHLCYENRDNFEVSQLCNYFAVLSRWKQVLTVDNDTRVIIKDNKDKWEPDDLELKVRQSLFDQKDEKTYVLNGTTVSVINFTDPSSATIKVEAELLGVIAKNSGNASLGYQIDEGKIEKIDISGEAGKIVNHEFVIDKGQHSVRFFLINPNKQTFVGLKLYERKAVDQEWSLIDIQERKKYLVATADNPIKYTIKGPAWVQVLKLTEDNQIIEDNYFVKAGKQQIILKAENNQTETFYKIFDRIPATPLVAVTEAQPLINYVEMKDAMVEISSRPEPKAVKIKDDLPLWHQDSGTWSLQNRLALALASDAVNPGTGLGGNNALSKEKGLIRFAEQTASFRYFSDLYRTHFKSDILIREFSKANPSYGLHLRLDYDPINAPVTFFTEGQAFAQRFNHESNHSLLGQVGIRNVVAFSRQLYHEAELAIFGRHINYTMAQQFDNKYPDPDVYTNYNKLHFRGADLSYNLNFNPWLDTKVSGGASARTNTKYNGIDQVNLKGSIDQLVGPFTIGADYNHRRYFRDQKRLVSFVRQQLGGHINWEHWLSKNNHRVEVNLTVAKVFDTNIPKSQRGALLIKKPMREWVGALGITLHLGNGRGYRDFRSNELKFRKVKEKDIPNKNAMRD